MQKESSFALHELDVIITILGYCVGYYSTSDRNHETGNRLFFENRKFQSLQPEVEKYRIGKLMSFVKRVIFSFFDSWILVAPRTILAGYVHIILKICIVSDH